VRLGDWLSRLGPFLGLVFVSALFGVLVGPEFFRPGNLELVARQTAIVGTAALGMTLVIAAGGIDLSVGSIIALSTVAVAQLLRAGHDPLVAALGGIAAGALCGAVTGVLVTRLQVIPFIVTLGMMLLVRGAAKGLAGERRLEAPASWLNDLLRTLAKGEGLLPWGLWLLAVLALLVAGILRYTRFGRHVLAVGSNERTARLCGIAVDRTKVAVYTLSAALAGLAGVLQFAKLSVGDPTVATGLELDVIAAVIIGGGSLLGGKGTALGTLVGATLMTVINIGCSQKGLPNWVQQIVTGLVIVAAVTLDRWRQGRAMASPTEATPRA
jgi:ribose/xylose/arabinose/galactoside ABC-type transport system permease subunit